jgi:hypothetical protein
MTNKNVRKLSTLLLFLGVAAWVPFIILVARGQAPSIYPFLAVHLTGVIGGSRLRARAKEAGEKRPRRQVIGRVLIILGVLAWAPYFYQHSVLHRSVQIDPYLTFHLTGVLGGLALLLSVRLERLWRESRRDSALEEAVSS